MAYFLFVLFLTIINLTKGEPIVPALFIFGDSIVDVGNNNNLFTAVKSNFFPYGRDFLNHSPTGRFSNGKLVVDLASELIGFASYQPAYLNLNFEENNILNGVNFASAASGYLDSTATLTHVVSLSQQLEYFKDCQNKLVKIVGQANATSILSGAAYFLVAGSVDFVLNYYMNPVQEKIYTPYQFSNILLECYTNFIRNLYESGARKVGVASLPPIGCLPIIISFFGFQNTCVENINKVAIDFNGKLDITSKKLQNMLPGLKLVIFDTFQPLYELITRPTDYGFFEARKACCGTGVLEVAIICNPMSVGTCVNASRYVFWDSFHPTEATNKVLMDRLTPIVMSLLLP
ncbi:unnamed protein product [Trifolium pratense]|uniref:Uncharacterized protein n=1 Tax=Trifolium pratense TaxID=57577 RepID=A0ACB0KFB9_TRIPR|nr:unnamed protein product [Trifolium pratense]